MRAQVLGRAKALEAQGKHIVHLELGEPDFDTPEHVIAAGAEAMRSGATHYTPAAGTADFREAVAAHVARTRGVQVDPAHCIAFPGAKPIMFYTLLALVEEGDEVLYPNPGFPIYESMIDFSGGHGVPLPMKADPNTGGARLDVDALEALVSARTKLIILNSPNNPTGGVLTHDELEVIAAIATKHNVTVLSDEVYDMILYDGLKHESLLSFPGMLERTILLAGHSKNYAMTGWRLGYGVFPPSLAPMISRLVTNSSSCTAAFTQAAGIAALEGPQEATHAMVSEFQKRRDLVVSELNAMGLTCPKPEGAFYAFPSIRDAGVPWLSSADLADYFLYECGVALLSGTCFGARGDGHLRLSYATSQENLKEALGRMAKGLERLRADPTIWPGAGAGTPAEAPANTSASMAHDGIDLGALSASAEETAAMSDVGFITSMLMVLIGNYSRAGHFGGPLAYVPMNTALHLGGREHGGLVYDIRDPKSPFADKFLMAAGHCANTNYALWMVLYGAMRKQHAATGDERFRCPEEAAILPCDAAGFRRSEGACKGMLQEAGVAGHPAFDDVPARGVRALSGHTESTDVTNDVNGGPSGVGLAGAAGKAVFWEMAGAPKDLKVVALEGEFALTEGHAQELKTLASAQQVGKRLRVLVSNNNAGIDDALVGHGGVLPEGTGYDLAAQFASYGWNVFELPDGADYEAILDVLATMERWPEEDTRPMVCVAATVKGWWPGAVSDEVCFGDGDATQCLQQLTGHKSHPFGLEAHGEYVRALAATFEERFGIAFVGLDRPFPATEAERLVQLKTNVDLALGVLDKDGGALRGFVAERLLAIAEDYQAGRKAACAAPGGLRFATGTDSGDSASVDPFEDARLAVANLPDKADVPTRTDGASTRRVQLRRDANDTAGPRRAISEVGAWINHVTGDRWVTLAADLSSSINVEAASLSGHYDPATNPTGTRLKAGIQEAANAATAAALASQSASLDPAHHSGVWSVTGTYGAFTPLFYLPLRAFAQQNQDSPFKLGVVTVVAGHSGPETAADARSHFGIFSPAVWSLFPKGQCVNVHPWDYNDVAPAYFAAAAAARENHDTCIIALHVARPDTKVADRATFADSDPNAAAKGAYLVRDYKPRRGKCRGGTVLAQGCSATRSAIVAADRLLEEEGIAVRVVACVSEELFDLQPKAYRNALMPGAAYADCMAVTSGTKKLLPLAGCGPLTAEYSMTSDHDDKWRTGGTEEDIIREAKLDAASVYEGLKRFAEARTQRLDQQRKALRGW